ncbi:MAG: zinc ABC transporter substrate-binding protein, partial [Planctomycetia bacterium]|nr:zinc ABC transporter substrate-binding protein [Planctomycetia bacterium]
AHGHEAHHDCEHHDHHEHATGQDPHIWLSLKNMRKIIGDLTVFLTELDPENGAFYAENAQKLLTECDTLDAEFQATTATLKNRQLVVSHRAFGYLCQDYGLEQVALEGYSAYSDPSPAQMVKIVEFIRENQVPVIFVDLSETRKGADAIARETGVKIAVLHPMGTLTEEQLKAGADYFSVMRENLEALKALR